MDIKILKDKMAKYSRPDNCEMIRVPRVNTPVWKTLESHQRRNDVKITNIQKTCAAVGASLAYTLDMVCKDQSSSDLDTSQIIRYVADAMAMLGHINTDLSLLRRELMRPTLHADYRNLCNPDHPVTSLLFGDDLQKEMKDLKETSMIGSKVSSNYHNYGICHNYGSLTDQAHYSCRIMVHVDLTTMDRGSFFGEVARKPEPERNITSRKQDNNNPSN